MDKHLISFFSSENPELLYWQDSEPKSLSLSGQLEINFSEEKYCIGYNDGTAHYKCRNHALNCSQCPTCKYSDISKVYTRLNFSGYEHLIEEIVNREYSVYLAYFGGPAVKAGVTRRERVQKRLREQGAILWAEIMQFDNANDAYNMESLLQQHFNLKNAVRSKYKLENMFNLNESLLPKTIESIKSEEPFSSHLLGSLQINKFEYKIPRDFSFSPNIKGHFLDSKGNLLFYKDGSGVFAVDMKENEGKLFSTAGI